ncbi:sigma factor-like helix-turn-helix DNA-binding protein [Amycolatopsis sp. QT-25]|uniref:sigma factor-like helix-turn-helix DNA-binding protein n=1 Tax=Amycolatopsis sp. QT-25 TaxID=3034022 RepID=UPI0023ED5208|nr:sigma factor-like helix-turn-helix DNA-binding protein [Amycolatopsis sp. QT-25]WET78951.1 sigma factor-like helix-turn-helix DNA-binding protein [Amycolatopsis sp. QT-25]
MQGYGSRRPREAGGRTKTASKPVDTVRVLVVRYCRARIGRRSGTYEAADAIAKAGCREVFAGAAGASALLTFAYDVTRGLVDDFHRTTTELPNPLSGLPDRQREILVLRSLVGLSADDTALALGCTVQAVRLGQHRALTALRPTRA